MEDYGLLAHTFKQLADNLVEDYDVVELAQQLVDSSVTLLPVTSVGLLICDSQGDLHVLASSSEEARLLETLQLAADLGPCLLAYRTGQQVVVEDLRVDPQRWPAFAERAEEYHYRSVCALPLRLRGERVGALDLFREEVGSLTPADIAVGQALADMATIGILHQRVMTRSELITQQLQTALNTRVVIEQAKGVLAERGGIDMKKAFTLMRSHARRTHQRLADLARVWSTTRSTPARSSARTRPGGSQNRPAPGVSDGVYPTVCPTSARRCWCILASASDAREGPMPA